MSPRPNRGGEYGRRARTAVPAPSSPGLPPRPKSDHPGLLPPDWTTTVYLALDFETTGLDPARERVVEIGALRFTPGAQGSRLSPGQAGAIEVGALSSLVDPGIRIPREVIAIHGITNEDVEGAPSFAGVGPILTALAAGAYLVAHNAPFDLSFLRAELSRAGLNPPLNPVLDTRIIARAAFPGLSSYKLVDLAARFGIDKGRSHRALDDARTCMELLLICAEKLAPRA